MTHNPALLNGLQIVFVVALLLVVSVPAAYLKAKGPNAFILRAIVNQVNQLNLVIPFYAFNKKLRKYAWKATKTFFGLNNQVQDLPPQPGMPKNPTGPTETDRTDTVVTVLCRVFRIENTGYSEVPVGFFRITKNPTGPNLHL